MTHEILIRLHQKINTKLKRFTIRQGADRIILAVIRQAVEAVVVFLVDQALEVVLVAEAAGAIAIKLIIGNRERETSSEREIIERCTAVSPYPKQHSLCSISMTLEGPPMMSIQARFFSLAKKKQDSLRWIWMILR